MKPRVLRLSIYIHFLLVSCGETAVDLEKLGVCDSRGPVPEKLGEPQPKEFIRDTSFLGMGFSRPRGDTSKEQGVSFVLRSRHRPPRLRLGAVHVELDDVAGSSETPRQGYLEGYESEKAARQTEADWSRRHILR